MRARDHKRVAEGLNSKIMGIKRKACGYRNLDHFKTPSTSAAAVWTFIRSVRDGGGTRGKPWRTKVSMVSFGLNA
jgi:hypothetical protein